MEQDRNASVTIPFNLYGCPAEKFTFVYDREVQDTVQNIKGVLANINSETGINGVYIGVCPNRTSEVREVTAPNPLTVDQMKMLSREVTAVSDDFFSDTPKTDHDRIQRALAAHHALVAVFKRYCNDV